MNTQHTFVAERRAAQHCPQLLRASPEPADQIGALARLGERLSTPLAQALGQLLGGELPAVAVLPPHELGETELVQQIGPLAANSLFATGVPGVTLLASIEGTAVLRLVDRAYGGKGETSGPLPEAFPLSAELLVQRLEAILTDCLAAALGQADLRALRRAPQLSELTPFPAGARLAVLPIEVIDGDQPAWTLTLALPLATLPKLLGSGAAGALPAAPRSPRAADPAAAPFAALPLGLTATLVDMPVSLAAIAALVPGSVLPVTVARAVPLAIGSSIIARGTIGAQDDRIAIQLTQLAG